MTFSRIAHLPFDHLQAEYTAFPIASEASLGLGLIALDPELSDKTGQLWRAAERSLIASFPSFSIDEAVAIRDRVWFGITRHRGPIPVSAFLREQASHLLVVRGGVAVPSTTMTAADPSLPPDAPEAGARLAWRWMTYALPADLLLAILGASAADTLSPPLARSLAERGYAEAHQHVGAGLDFGAYWIATMRAVAWHELPSHAFVSPGAELNEGRDLAPWLVRAGIVRGLLAHYLVTGDCEHGFSRHIERRVFPRFRSDGWATGEALLRLVLGQVWAGSLGGPPVTHAAPQRVYQALLGPLAGRLPSGFELLAVDPIAGLFPMAMADQASPEQALITRALAYLDGSQADPFFERIFWQMIRIRCLFYRHVTQRPMTPGLQWFIRFYGRIGPGRKPIGQRLLVGIANRTAGAAGGLRALELRTSPDPSLTNLHQLVGATDPRNAEGPEIGLVLHFTKERSERARHGLPAARSMGTHADPRENPSGYRYAAYYAKKKAEALAFAREMLFFPVSIEVLRGVDVCTDELGIPTWVVAPLFRYVRDAAASAHAVLRGLGLHPSRRFGATAHAGEDFVHLLGGLRRVDEAVDHLRLGEGDRIGHGLALGVDAVDWARRAGRVALPIEERLLDLVWEWSFSIREHVGVGDARRALVEREIARLSKRLFERSFTPYDMESLVSALHSEASLRHAGFPHRGPPGSPSLLLPYLTDPGVFSRGQELEWVETAGEAEVLHPLQSALRAKVSRLGLTVEINPSSNLLIGNLGDLRHHPLWRLRPVVPDAGQPGVAIAIGSDDPLTFCTSLPQEYQLIEDTLALAGVGEVERRAWIEAVRERGLESRFTCRRTKDLALTAYARSRDPPLDPLP